MYSKHTHTQTATRDHRMPLGGMRASPFSDILPDKCVSIIQNLFDVVCVGKCVCVWTGKRVSALMCVCVCVHVPLCHFVYHSVWGLPLYIRPPVAHSVGTTVTKLTVNNTVSVSDQVSHDKLVSVFGLCLCAPVFPLVMKWRLPLPREHLFVLVFVRSRVVPHCWRSLPQVVLVGLKRIVFGVFFYIKYQLWTLIKKKGKVADVWFSSSSSAVTAARQNILQGGVWNIPSIGTLPFNESGAMLCKFDPSLKPRLI